MTDLSKARPGCEVTFRCGGKATIDRTNYRCPSGPVYDLWFKEYWRCETFLSNGKYTTDPRAHPLDILEVTDPPLSDAERLALTESLLLARDATLAEIARILGRSTFASCGSLHRAIPEETLERLLALAEGRSGS